MRLPIAPPGPGALPEIRTQNLTDLNRVRLPIAPGEQVYGAGGETRTHGGFPTAYKTVAIAAMRLQRWYFFFLELFYPLTLANRACVWHRLRDSNSRCKAAPILVLETSAIVHYAKPAYCLVLPAGLEPATCANLAPMPRYKLGVLPIKLQEQIVLGWLVGFEPTNYGVTVRRLGPLADSHH